MGGLLHCHRSERESKVGIALVVRVNQGAEKDERGRIRCRSVVCVVITIYEGSDIDVSPQARRDGV